MVVVVVALAVCNPGCKTIVSSVRVLVIGTVTPEMSKTVYAIYAMGRDGIAKAEEKKEGHHKIFVPEIPGNKCWDEYCKKHAQPGIVPLLEHDHWVFLQVTHINALSLDQYVREVAQYKPTNVAEKEPASRIVWISVCVYVPVVESMVSGPPVNSSMKSCTVKAQQ